MSFEIDNPTSPMFLILLAMVLLDMIYAWSGLVRGELPNMRATLLGARVAGASAAISLAFVFVSYYCFFEAFRLYGTIALGIAFGMLVGGLLLSERIHR
jgi:hypothetical protein